MNGHPEMFPMSEEERIGLLRSNLASDVEKRLAKRDAAAVALADAQDLEDVARGLLSVFDSMVAERAARHAKGVMQGAADIINSGALDHDGVTVTASVSPAVDPITGEVEAAVSTVFALYPGDDDPHETPVGSHTRYGELVADYFTAAGLTGKHDAKDWSVVAEDELTTTGGARKLRDVIEAGDYGKRLLVTAADQGSVTGAPAEKMTP